MSNIGGAEVFVVLLLALLVLGPERLPKAARQAGNFIRQVRSISTGFQNEIRGAMQEDGPSTPEASRIRPVPAITDRPDGGDSGSTRVDRDLDTDVRARNDGAVSPAVDPTPGHEAAPDERAAG
jgi:Tat protein translocase TatB subunit